MAVRFNLARAEGKGLQAGDGIPVHVTIPTDRPWVPLRILGLGRSADEIVEADVFLLNEKKPQLMPGMDEAGSSDGLVHERSERASEALLTDLAGDRGMDWLPTEDMWLDYIRINTPAEDLDHDLAISVDGETPSPVDAGYALAGTTIPRGESTPAWAWLMGVLLLLLVLMGSNLLVSRR
jgi:hypothetical protein